MQSVSVNLTYQGKATLGSFGKAQDPDAAVALNFAPSGGDNCVPPDEDGRGGCQAWNECYAKHVEAYKARSLGVTLARHSDANPADLCRSWLAQMRRRHATRPIVWIRLSAFGSVPTHPRMHRGFVAAMRDLLVWARDQGIPVHFPTEDSRKASRYRRLFSDLVTVRVSSGTDHAMRTRTRHHQSAVIGSKGQTIPQRLAECRDAVRRYSRSRTARIRGLRGMVCPAVAATMHGRKTGQPPKKIGCGIDPKTGRGCDGCSDPRVGLVVFPLHR